MALLDHIRVDYHGTLDARESTRLALRARTDYVHVISPWDPGAVPLIDKAIRTSDLGLNPTNDGKFVRVPIPPLTEDRRKDIVKHLHKVLENHRTAVRNASAATLREAVEKLEKEKKISEDERKRSIDEAGKADPQRNEKNRGLSADERKRNPGT